MEYIKTFELFKFNRNKNAKIVYHTQTTIYPEKIKGILKKLTPMWIVENPVAFEVYEEKLYITEGHHRLEAAIKLGDKTILRNLFTSALYYDVKYKPQSFKKRKIVLV